MKEIDSKQFLEQYVKDISKRNLLKDYSKRNCDLIGIVGRKAFHIFDKTHRTWICSSKNLAYEKLF